MRYFPPVFFSFCFAVSVFGEPSLGFLPQSHEVEARYESVFLSVPAPARERAWLRALTEEPHVAGTEQDKKYAEYVRDRLIEFGIPAELVPYEVYLNYPRKVSLRMVAPEPQELSMVEQGYPQDKDSYSPSVFPGFHGYGASGTVRAQVIYVNYGTVDDFDELESRGFSVAGKIVLVRYGKIFRGLKVREAQNRGATGVLIYSDPADDGYMKGDVYPDGAMRPESGIQRGSVRFVSEAAGDPTTPGWPSLKGAKRIDPIGLPRIPSLPMSYGEAQKILKSLSGQPVPEGWQGGLPFAYHLGPGGAEVEMEVEMDYGYRTIWNVVGRIQGSAEDERLIILGNHRDAWTYGAVDPNSGTASFLEAARGMAGAWEAGWRPRRTILLASWDGEEYGLLGSTEWVEDHSVELSQNCVAYINLDSSVSGADLSVGGIPSLRNLIMEVAAAVSEPRAGGTLLDAWTKRAQKTWAKTFPVDLDAPQAGFQLQLESLGSGSDYVPFVDHLGIPALNFGFGGSYGVYHSRYDSMYWMEHFGDPEFLYHTAASRMYGLLAMRLSGADIIPFRYVPYSEHLHQALDSMRRQSIVEQRLYAVEPGKKAPLNPDFTPLTRMLDDFAASAKLLDEALDRVQNSSGIEAGHLASLNDALIGIEREFLDPVGLPGRAWFRHLLFAPGFNAGYDAWVFPGLAQALDDCNAALFDAEMKRLIARLASTVARMKEAARLAE